MQLVTVEMKTSNSINDHDDPIAIATALYKVLEQVLLSRLARYLLTADSQFGFKQAHGTEIAIFVLKQTMDFTVIRTQLYTCDFLMQKFFS